MSILNMQKSRSLLAITLLAAASASVAGVPPRQAGDKAPIEKVKKIGDKLIRETPFAYRLGLARDSHVFNGVKTVDFYRSLGNRQSAVAYAFTRLTAPADTTIEVQIAHSGDCTAWCNGEPVYHGSFPELHYSVEERSVELPASFTLKLDKGANTLLFRSQGGGPDWRLLIQPPSFHDAVLSYIPQEISIGIEGITEVGADVAGLSDWLIAGPFPTDATPEILKDNEIAIGRMYEGLEGPVTWSIPRVEVLGKLIDPAPWGTTYQWNYHNGGVARAMQNLAEYSGQKRYDDWASRFCDYHLDGMAFVDYQTNTLMAFDSANSRILDCPLLDFTLAPSLPFIHRLVRDGASGFEGSGRYQAFVDKMLRYAAEQVKSPGMANYARVTPEKYTVWVDDMFMGIPFLVEASRYVSDPAHSRRLLDEAAAQVLDFNRHVWDRQAGLYMHANYSSRPDRKLPHWSRANGWGLWAMADVLDALPSKHKNRAAILKHFRTHARSLAALQDRTTGLWHNVLDRSDSPLETSGSAIFVMAMARGVDRGWLDEKEFTPVVTRGWKGVASRIDDDGTVRDICVGTMCSTDEEYYVNRPFYDNDTHGSFAVIFCGVEVQKMLDRQAGRIRDTRFEAAKPSDEEIAYILRDLEKLHPAYDKKMHMLASRTSGRHYHSDLDSGALVHQTRESLEYATALLKTGKKEFTDRGIDIIRAVLPFQETDPSLPYCGVWPYYPEDPLKGRKAPVDYNWADFIAVPLIDAVVNHSDILPSDLREEIGRRLVLAAKAVQRRDVQPDYTNMIIMGTYVCYAVGDLYGIGSLKSYARSRLRKFYDYTRATKGFTEYNSPTYTVVALNELLRLKQCISCEADHKLVDELYTAAWDVIGRHFHAPSGQWCGPNLRAYSNLSTEATRRLFYNASDGAINLPGDYPRFPDVLRPHRIPDKVLSSFTRPDMPRIETDTFVAAENAPSVVGRVYMAPKFAIASVNQSYMWNQTRPLIVHFGTAEAPSYLRLRFLHDNYDFSAVNIFSAQDSTMVLSMMNLSWDGGDRHPSIDRIAGRRFKASDLRLRVELGGDRSNCSFALPESTDGCLAINAGGLSFCLKLPFVAWDGCKGHWELGHDNETAWADYVIYSGLTHEFNMDSMESAAIGLCLRAGDCDDDTRNFPPIEATPDGDYLSLKCGGLEVRGRRRCAPEADMRTDFQTYSSL